MPGRLRGSHGLVSAASFDEAQTRTPHGEVLVDDDEVLVLDGVLVVVVVVVVVEFVTVRVGAVTEMPIEVDRVSVFWAVVVLLEPPSCVNA